MSQLATKVHVRYFQRLLQVMPSGLAEFDSSRLMIAFLAFSGLDLLNWLDEIDETTKSQAVDWIYRLQVRDAGPRSGFQGSTTIPKDAAKYQCGHLALTYTGLVTLLILGDDLTRVDRESLVEGVRACQNPDGSFTAMVSGCESDMRFLYCACCVSAILDDWSGIDVPKATDYILRSVVSFVVVGDSCWFCVPLMSEKSSKDFMLINFSRTTAASDKGPASSLTAGPPSARWRAYFSWTSFPRCRGSSATV